MSLDLSRVPTPELINAAMRAGEGQQIEFTTSTPASAQLGKLISGFANASGGLILVGVGEHPTRITGCNFRQLSQVFERASLRIKPTGMATLHHVPIGQKDVGAIIVRPSPLVVMSEEGGAFVRSDDDTRAMTASEIRARLPVREAIQPQPLPPPDDGIAVGISGLTQTIEELRWELSRSQSFKRKLRGILTSFAVGVATGVIANYLFKAMGN